MATAQSVIKKCLSILDNATVKDTAALNQVVKAVSKFTNWSQLISTMIKYCAFCKIAKLIYETDGKRRANILTVANNSLTLKSACEFQ